MTKTERNNAIVKARVEDGLKIREIAKKFGITKQRVSQILRTYSIGGRDCVYLRNEDRLYDFIVKYKMEHNGTNPSFREIRQNVGALAVYSYALAIRDRLIKKGKLTSNATKKITWSSIEVTGSFWIPPLDVIEEMPEDDLMAVGNGLYDISYEIEILVEEKRRESRED